MNMWFAKHDKAEIYCCVGFKNLISNAGERGLSALVSEIEGAIRFELQGRAIPHPEELDITGVPGAPQIGRSGTVYERWTVSANIALNFCPFCGRNLQKLISKSTKRNFQQLAAEHSKIYASPISSNWIAPSQPDGIQRR